MKNVLSSRRTRPRVSRRGNVAVLAALMAMILLGMVAFTVDVGYVLSSQQELQRTADAAAMAACWSYGKKRFDGVDWPDAMASARIVAADYAAANVVGNHATAIDLNSTNSLNGDLVFGYIDDFWNPNFSQQTSSVPYFNSVKLRVRRNDAYNGKVPYFFAKVFGATGQSIEAEATAAYLRNIGGFQIPHDGSNVPILPFALDLATWEDMLYSGIGSDDYTWNEQTQSVSNGADGRLEINLYPEGVDESGNRGTVDIGTNDNTTENIERQILYGVSPEDLAFHGGKLEFNADGELFLNGDTGISNGFKDELAAIVGQPRIIPIFSSVSGPGNNATYTIVQWVGVRVVEAKLTTKHKRVIVQPAPVVTDGVIPANHSNKSNFVSSPVVLVR